MTNPRHDLLPPMPRPPCKVSVIGPPCSGKSTLCALLAQHYGAELLDLEALTEPVVTKLRQEMLEKVRQDVTQQAIEKIRAKMEMNATNGRSELVLRMMVVVMRMMIIGRVRMMTLVNMTVMITKRMMMVAAVAMMYDINNDENEHNENDAILMVEGRGEDVKKW